ncbi:MAG: MmgE/PrpD family protein [Acidimicrobiia bacterium]|nr:MmgE/PrpD family protein [Acidimicrobiia bacterium]
MTLTEELAAWASTMTLDDVPDRVVAYARSQVLSQLAAARASLDHPLGQKVVTAFGAPTQPDPHRAATVLASLTMALDYDDTVYAGHVTHSSVNVPLAYAAPLGLDGRSLLAAVVAAGECAARVTASATLGPHRGQTAAHAHLVGAPAARLHAEQAPPETWVNAWGLALAAPPWSAHRAFLGSDAKVFTASVPVGTGLDACDAAIAGLRGASDILEHPEGFLTHFATEPLPEAAVAGLGERWHTETTSFKVYPGCAYLDPAIDCAVSLHRHLPALRAEEVREVIVHAGILTLAVDLRAAAYVNGSDSSVAALNFSMGYSVATALLTGGLTHRDFCAPRLENPERWDLATKVRVDHDDDITRRSLLATAPLGEALRQAGPERARAWLVSQGGEAAEELAAELAAELEPPALDFSDADKAIGGRVEVHLHDGRVLEESCEIPIGAVGPAGRVDHPRLTREKFLACGGSVSVADAIAHLEDLSTDDVTGLLAVALS